MSELPTSNEVAAPAAPAVKPAPNRGHGPSVTQLAIVVGIMAAGVLFTIFTSDVTKNVPTRYPVMDDKPFLNASVGDWQGGKMDGLSDDERAILPKDTEGARRLYHDPSGHQLSCSIILAGRDVTSIHRFEMCSTGQGWKTPEEFVESIKIPTAPGGVLRIMRMNSWRENPAAQPGPSETHAIFAYWFIGKGRVTPYHWQRILWNMEDRLLHNRNHRWAYVLIHMPVPAVPPTELDHAEDATMQTIGQFYEPCTPR